MIEKSGSWRLLGRSTAIQAVVADLQRLAPSLRPGHRVPPILLQGETGTGKGLFARSIHETSPRASGPFVDLNCAAIPSTLIEAELFGFERGTFTDARQARTGLVQAAHLGTLFLDEIGLLPQDLQVKLLSVLETREVRPLGGLRAKPVDVLIIAATNTDLRTAVRDGGFREDLYHRLAVLVFSLPPLRDRGDDILEMADAFLARACADHGLHPKTLSEDARAALLRHPWPGNVRELGNLMERIALLTPDDRITAHGLGLPAPPGPGGALAPEGKVDRSLKDSVATFTRARLEEALGQTRGNVSVAADLLGIPRSTLRYQLERLGLKPEATRVGRPRAARAPVAAGPAPPPTTDAERILPSSGRLEGERKQVTVLFAEFKRSTELFTDHQPEESLKLFDPVLDRMTEAVQRFGGTIVQVRVGGIMALFGAPVAYEDHAVRACYAALSMHEAIGRDREVLKQAQGIDVQIRVGLNSGDVAVRTIGSDFYLDYSAIPQTTHVAARLEKEARPETTLMTAATQRLAEGFVEVVPLGPVPVAGLARPVEVYELRAPGRVRSRLAAAVDRGLTRFVGRAAEMEQLRRAQQLGSNGHGQMVAVVGEAGVGKSRLVYEFTHSQWMRGWLVLEGVSVSYGQTASYLPVIDLLKNYFKIQDRDDLREIRERVTGKLLALDHTLGPTLPALLALLDVPVDDTSWHRLDPAQRQRQTLDAVKRLLLREAHNQPLLLIFENLHWIDSETQALLDGLVEILGSARLLVLVNYRPEYQHAWGNKASYSQLRLDALSAESAGQLLEALLGDDPGLAPLKERLVKRGNPFFLEETIRTLVETNVLAGERGGYRLTQPVQTIQIPRTVQAILAARIDRLAPEDKRLLQVASVVGKDVPFALLKAIAEMSDEALRRGVEHLQSTEFLYETGLYPDLEYSFKHALTHEVTYSGLLQERRRELHARTVDMIETLHQDRRGEDIERLAHHALRGELWDKAVAYLRQAGLRAMVRGANREAVSCFEQALTALGHLPETRETLEQAIDLRFDLRTALSLLGEFERIFGCLREAEGLAKTLDDQRRLGQLSVYMCHNLYITGHPAEALTFGQNAQAISESLGDIPLQVTGNTSLGGACLFTGDYRRAEDLLVKVLHLLEGDLRRERFGLAGHPAVLARGLLTWGFTDRGEFEEGIANGQEAARLAEALEHPYDMAFAWWALAHLHIGRGELSHAVGLLERGVALTREWDLTYFSVMDTGSLGYAYALSGRIAEGIPLLEHAVNSSKTMGFGLVHPLYLVSLGEAYALGDRLEDALAFAGRALTLARERGQRLYEAWARRLVGEISARHDPPEHANRHYRDALALAVELGMRPLVAHCHLGLGKLYGSTGKHKQAQEHLATATTMYREMDMRFWLEKAEESMKELGPESAPFEPRQQA
jgi:DNA-binding NtrC family response regulator/class 3 adenylate cyclase/tetratricopeptide (TPR) repeat protein